MKSRHKKLALIGGALAIIGIIAALVLNALNSNIALYITPTDVAAGKAPKDKLFRIGGLVKEGSVERGADRFVSFVVSDGAGEVRVRYTGLLPDLFREGQGIVAEGVLEDVKSFRADSVLAKHDETYMPREVADALKKQGHWQNEKQVGSK